MNTENTTELALHLLPEVTINSIPISDKIMSDLVSFANIKETAGLIEQVKSFAADASRILIKQSQSMSALQEVYTDEGNEILKEVKEGVEYRIESQLLSILNDMQVYIIKAVNYRLHKLNEVN